MTIITIISFIILPLLFLYKAEWKTENKDFLSINQTTQMKGMFAIFVMIVHFSQRMGNAGPMVLFKNPGYLAVGGFFFLSGYGMYSSFIKNKEISIKKSFNRLMHIYKPFILITIVYMVIIVLYNNGNYSKIDILLNIINIKQIDPITWYLMTMVYFYIAFHISYRYFKGKKCEIALLILSFMYLIAAIVLKNKEIWWYNTSFMFFTGVIFKKYENELYNKVRNREIVIFTFGIILFGIHLILLRDNVISQSIITVIVIIGFMILNFRVKYNSKLFILMGSISYELYLVHMKFYNLFFKEQIYGREGNIDFVIFALCTIIISTLFYGSLNLKKLIKERRKKSE